MKKILIIIVSIIIVLLISSYIIYQNNISENNIEELVETYNDENLILENKEESIEKEIVIPRITVEIKGEVVSPGVYELNENSRVIDLINLAGGLTTNAVTNNINLAKILKDEMVVIIYNQKDLIEEVKTEYVYLECTCPEVANDACIKDENKIDNTKVEESKQNKKISINNATLEELTTLNGIGEKMANKIIEYRTSNSFQQIEDIKNVSGIGESLYEKIKDSITI